MSYYDYPSFEVEIIINNHSYSEIIESEKNISSLRKQFSRVKEGDFITIEKIFESFSKDISSGILKEDNNMFVYMRCGDDYILDLNEYDWIEEEHDYIDISFYSDEFDYVMNHLKNISKEVFNTYLDFFVTIYDK